MRGGWRRAALVIAGDTPTRGLHLKSGDRLCPRDLNPHVSEGRVAPYVHACADWRAGRGQAAVSGRADGWIRWTSTSAWGILALIVVAVPYLRGHLGMVFAKIFFHL